MMRPEDIAPMRKALFFLPIREGEGEARPLWRCSFWLFAFAYDVKGGLDGRSNG